MLCFQDICSGGILHITDKGQLETRPKVTRDKVNNIVKWTDAFFDIFVHLSKNVPQ